MRRDGFVLIAALWLLIALGAVGLDASLRSRTERTAAANALDKARYTEAATAGVEYARSRLTAAMLGRVDELRSEVAERERQRRADNARRGIRTTARRLPNNNRDLFRQAGAGLDPWREPEALVEETYMFEDVPAELHVRDTGAGLNPNYGDEEVLRLFLGQGLRVDAALADRLAQAILDWRDEDENTRINGGEAEQYIRDGLPVLPPNRQIARLDELRHVMGMTDELFAEMLPFMTLSGTGRININSAPEEVLLAIPGITGPAAAEIVRMRRAGQFPTNATELRAMLPRTSANAIQAAGQRFTRRVTFNTDEVEITSEVKIPGNPVRVRVKSVVARANVGAAVVWREVEQ